MVEKDSVVRSFSTSVVIALSTYRVASLLCLYGSSLCLALGILTDAEYAIWLAYARLEGGFEHWG
jgi:hypothetical protein